MVPAGLSFEPVELTQLGHTAVRVLLVRNGTFGSLPQEKEVDWPDGWRIPQQGDFVHFSPDWGGPIRYCDFDLAGRIIKLFLS